MARVTNLKSKGLGFDSHLDHEDKSQVNFSFHSSPDNLAADAYPAEYKSTLCLKPLSYSMAASPQDQ